MNLTSLIKLDIYRTYLRVAILTLFWLTKIEVVAQASKIYGPPINSFPIDLDFYKPSWNLVWSDEFDGTLSNWGYDCGIFGYEFKDPNLSYVSNGKLHIPAVWSPSNYPDKCIPPAIMKPAWFRTTSLKSTVTFGPGTYIETRCKLPKGKWLWPAVFTFDASRHNSVIADKDCSCTTPLNGGCVSKAFGEIGNKLWSEIDIYEHPNCDESLLHEFHSNYHVIEFGNDYKYNCAIYNQLSNFLPSLHEQYYTVGVLWEVDRIVWFVNNSVVRIETEKIPQEQSEIWLSMGIDGSASIQELQQMVGDGEYEQEPGYDPVFKVDYVRVYERHCSEKVATSDYGLSDGYSEQNVTPRLMGDINGDNIADIVAFGLTSVEVSLGQGGGTFGPFITSINDCSIAQNWNTQMERPRKLADVNGDGRYDIVGFGHEWTIVYLGQASGGFSPKINAINDFTVEQGWENENIHPRQIGDVNNDGMDDIIGFGENKTYVALGQPNGTFLMVAGNNFDYSKNSGWSSQELRPRLIGDINGDGKVDIIGFGVNNTYVSFGQSNGTFSPSISALNNFTVEQGWISQEATPRLIGDVNGDNIDDIVGFGDVKVRVSLGSSNNGFGSVTDALNNYTRAYQWMTMDEFPRFIADVNGDCREDIVGFGNAAVKMALSKSTSNLVEFYEPQNVLFDFTSLEGWHTQNEYPRYIADVTGDGNNDIIGFGDNNTFVFDCLNVSLNSCSSKAILKPKLRRVDHRVEDSLVLSVLSPNPSSGKIFIRNLEDLRVRKIEVFSLSGKRVKEIKFPTKYNHFFIEEKGIFVAKIFTAGSVLMEKIIIH